MAALLIFLLEVDDHFKGLLDNLIKLQLAINAPRILYG